MSAKDRRVAIVAGLVVFAVAFFQLGFFVARAVWL